MDVFRVRKFHHLMVDFRRTLSADDQAISIAGADHARYQYGNETLDFGGGRLLLREVNGSGKSTAMNMLLPFLLDADTRRIDAGNTGVAGLLRVH
ncbi:MAG TPA: hypothetical protein VGL87_15370 [Steroidobacteraceae bacterium]